MIKGLNNTIICDECRRVITDKDYAVIIGKKRTLHYHKNGTCERAYEMIKEYNKNRRKRNEIKSILEMIMHRIVYILYKLYTLPFTILAVIIAVSHSIHLILSNRKLLAKVSQSPPP